MSAAPSSFSQGWKPVTEVLAVITRRFAHTQAGRTGRATNDILIDAEELLTAANAAAGPLRLAAIADLEAAERAGLLRLERNRRDPALLLQIRLAPKNAAEFHAVLGLHTPAEQRERFAEIFHRAEGFLVSDEYAAGWLQFCGELAVSARTGGSVQPFDRRDPVETALLLEVLPKLLAWRGESYVRFASCVVCGDSKRLERWAKRIGMALDRITRGTVSTLADLGIVENPRSVTLCGPLRFEMATGWLDLGLLSGVVRIAASDIDDAKQLQSHAKRCISIENETTLHELAKLCSPDLLIGTSFLGRGTRRLLERLPQTMELWHFGDSDPAGFAVLVDLRERAGRPVSALHMNWRPSQERKPLSDADRNTAQRLLSSPWLIATEKDVLRQQLEKDDKGAFEQESLGPPDIAKFPYYDCEPVDHPLSLPS